MKHSRGVSTVVYGMCVFALVVGSWGAVEAVSYPFTDDFESGLADWSAGAPWGTTTAFYASPAHSATDSPSTLYGASVDTSLTLGSSVDLTSATRPVLRFMHRYQIEDGYDFGAVELSTDGVSSWGAAVATYTGAQSEWVREQIDLASVAGYNDVRVRFRLTTDGTVSQDGWYIDDVVIDEGPAAVVLATPSIVTPNSVGLSWSLSADPAFLAYRIYRSSSSGVDWHTAVLVDEITNSATITHTDITVTPKTTFYYQVMMLTTSNLHSLSNEVSASTPAGMDYPFVDDGEGAATAWSADAPWALSTEDAFSGASSWSDSPGADYADSIASQSLTLVSPVDLSSATAPVLSFMHKWIFATADSGNVEISTDSGNSWTPLASYTGGDSGGWIRERFDLSAYVGSNNVLVRFRITTDPATGADGWHVDDISMAESPTVVDPPILDQITSHSMRLTWARCNDSLFSHYAIHRSAATGVGINSTLVTQISDQDTLSFTDTGLAVDTDYFYRVYAVNPYGTYSPDSTTESNVSTGANPYPFSEDFEGSLDNWTTTGSWGTTDTDQHGGTYSLTDSPSTVYPNSSTTEAWTSIDLTSSTWPVLRFWDRFAFADTGDWGIVDVSTNGTSWTRIYSVTGTRTPWSEQSIDLSPWKTSANLRIRFTVYTNSSVTDDGWYIDDLTVGEHSGSVSLPFFDDLESGTGNWLTSAWAPSNDTPHGGTWSAESTPQGLLQGSTQHAMYLGGELDLSSAVDPQLT
ncbi:MAG: immune inhibitor A, partial [Thermoanaerobaculales bacterium]|nr:immune inhibitor A [Thermoanaerobaculales bacterium]